jgi:hypothetical protein
MDLSAINPLAEIVVRAGDMHAIDAQQSLQAAYRRLMPAYPDAVGLSVLFRPGATLDELAREGAFPHAKLGVSVVDTIMRELRAVGYELVLFETPTAKYPDHHSLAVAVNGAIEQFLAAAAASALIRALIVVDNPYRARRPKP